MGPTEWAAIGAIGQCVAGAATVAAVLQAVKAARDATEVRISVSARFVTDPVSGERSLVINAQNDGIRPVQFTSSGLAAPRKWNAIEVPLASDNLPTVRQEWQAWSTIIPANDLANALKQSNYQGTISLRAFVEDATGRRHWDRRRWWPLRSLMRRGRLAFNVEKHS